MKSILSFLFFLLTISVYCQDNTGFYVQIEKKTNCPQEIRTFDDVQIFCVPNKPILDRTAFTTISEVKTDTNKKRKYIDLHLSKKGMDLLNTVVNSLPNATLILVVENKVVGVLKNKDIVGRFIRIDSDPASRQIEWIHDKLKPAP